MKIGDKVFNDVNFDNYIVQYEGDIQKEISQYDNLFVIVINEKYAILSVPKDFEINIQEPILKTVAYVKPAEFYTLQEITPVAASNASFLQLELPLKLTGEGVTVALIDTGIDYLSEEFMTEEGNTRIESIWDQTISGKEGEESGAPFGTIYRKEQIQEAINASRQGLSPYDIVPSKDDIGHGTNGAGIIGARGKNPKLKSMVPKCNFLVVKLIRDYSYESQFETEKPIYNITSIFAALEFAYRYTLNNVKPTIIYLPLGSNLGSHKGNSILEQYIESISIKRGLAIVTSTGNERNKGKHTSGIMLENEFYSIIEFDVSPFEKNLWIEVWVDHPNIMSIDVVSPSGESSGTINPGINETTTYNFIFEKTSVRVNYYLPEEFSGDELIRLRFYKIQQGIWKLRLKGEQILDGRFNVWMECEDIENEGTKFSKEDTYGTFTVPSTSLFVVTAAGYNQSNNNLVKYSGMAFINRYLNLIDVAAGSVNAITISPNNQLEIVSGNSVAAAVLAGACAILFEWGIVLGNYPNMYSQTLKTYLARGTRKRSGDIYPNAQWGYGILDVLGIFQNMI